MEEILRNRLRWQSYVHKMENNQLARQAMKLVQTGGQRKRGRPRKNWRTTMEDDQNVMGISWE